MVRLGFIAVFDDLPSVPYRVIPRGVVPKAGTDELRGIADQGAPRKPLYTRVYEPQTQSDAPGGGGERRARRSPEREVPGRSYMGPRGQGRPRARGVQRSHPTGTRRYRGGHHHRNRAGYVQVVPSDVLRGDRALEHGRPHPECCVGRPTPRPRARHDHGRHPRVSDRATIRQRDGSEGLRESRSASYSCPRGSA